MTDARLRQVYAYHFESKHRPERYAPGPGGLDWSTQPNPFRAYVGAPRVALPLQTAGGPAFSDIRAGRRPAPASLDLQALGRLLALSFGLSAWKSFADNRWALRCNPSSGNLHPTEAYLITGDCSGLAAGVYHYHSQAHALERRAADDTRAGAEELGDGVVLALTSIHWREAWKYGLRAYRYCQHDIGHALAALAYAAATLGWRVEPLGWSDPQIAAVLGLDRTPDFDPAEQEAPDCALWIGPGAARVEVLDAWLARPRSYLGQANRLSPDHLDWHGIELVHRACWRDSTAQASRSVSRPELAPQPAMMPLPGDQEAAALILQRRSAVAFDGETVMGKAAWIGLLDALLPRHGVPPFDALAWAPCVSLLLFVHRVEEVAPGLYMLVRAPEHLDRLRQGFKPEWSWARVDDLPAHLGLYRLIAGDARQAARALSCHHDIAGDSCFAVAMLADFDAALAQGPWCYRELFWECGLIGQVLYLEAEAAGLRGTGIGCFFDDAVHDLLGIQDTAWQSLYHFTLGGPIEDTRLRTEPPYAHLGERVG